MAFTTVRELEDLMLGPCLAEDTVVVDLPHGSKKCDFKEESRTLVPAGGHEAQDSPLTEPSHCLDVEVGDLDASATAVNGINQLAPSPAETCGSDASDPPKPLEDHAYMLPWQADISDVPVSFAEAQPPAESTCKPEEYDCSVKPTEFSAGGVSDVPNLIEYAVHPSERDGSTGQAEIGIGLAVEVPLGEEFGAGAVTLDNVSEIPVVKVGSRKIWMHQTESGDYVELVIKLPGSRFQCYVCHESFASAQRVQLHYGRKHFNVSEKRNADVDDDLVCKAPAVLRKRKGGLHLLAVEAGGQPVGRCGKSFCNKYVMAEHMRKTHGAPKLYFCPHCTYESDSPFNVARHVEDMHPGAAKWVNPSPKKRKRSQRGKNKAVLNTANQPTLKTKEEKGDAG